MSTETIKYYIWGTGYQAEKLFSCYLYELSKMEIIGFIDNDRSKLGNIFHEYNIYSPEILNDGEDAMIIIANKFASEIKEQIARDYPFYKEKVVDFSMVIKRLQLLERYEKNEDEEYREIINELKTHELRVFNYKFVNKYEKMEIPIYFDDSKGLFYVDFKNKKMFFSSKYKNEDEVRKYYISVLLEQDSESPHLYIDNSTMSLKDAIIVDAGVAEGNFALDHIEEAKHIYLFEPDIDWVHALYYTFEPWKDKVTIIPKCVSNYINVNTTTIDNIVTEKIDFIKMDIEGEELYALMGAEQHLRADSGIGCAICTYHQEHAYQAIKEYLEKYDMRTEHTRGYMWFVDHYNEYRPPVLRRGVIRAWKETN